MIYSRWDQNIWHYWLGSLFCSSQTCTSYYSVYSDYFTCSSYLSISRFVSYFIFRSNFLFMSCMLASYDANLLFYSPVDSFMLFSVGFVDRDSGFSLALSYSSRSFELNLMMSNCLFSIKISWFLLYTICQYFNFSQLFELD